MKTITQNEWIAKLHHTTFSTWVNGYYSVPEKYRAKLAEILEIIQEELFEVDHE